MKNTGSKILCMLYCAPEAQPYLLQRAEVSIPLISAEMKGYRVRTSPLLTLYCLNLQTLANKAKQNKIKQNKTLPPDN